MTSGNIFWAGHLKHEALLRKMYGKSRYFGGSAPRVIGLNWGVSMTSEAFFGAVGLRMEYC